MIPALVLLAALPGGYIGGVIADKKGRKTVIILGQWLILSEKCDKARVKV